VVPGGVSHDVDDAVAEMLRADHRALRLAVETLFDIVDDHSSLEDRLVGTGVLKAEDARLLGCTGYVGKASGLDFDVRRHSAYAPYDRLKMDDVVQHEGDVAARVRVRIAEVHGSLELMDKLLKDLPQGEIVAPLPAGPAGASGLGIIDGWRGEIITYVRFDAAGRIARFFPRDPSWFTWPALERLIHGNIVPDFPVCNKSVNGSYSGQDL
jgi:Ni,Fe-hydrogenase III large subunit